jgi:hypothetical protein
VLLVLSARKDENTWCFGKIEVERRRDRRKLLVLAIMVEEEEKRESEDELV